MKEIIAKRCPVCGIGDIIKEDVFSSPDEPRIHCTHCGAQFAMKGNQFKIILYGSTVAINRNLLLRKDEWHTLREWHGIVEKGCTPDEEQKYADIMQDKLSKPIYIVSHVILHNGEKAHLEELQSEIYESHLLIDTSESLKKLRQIDIGTLLLTNKRLIFSGSNSIRTIKLEKIAQVHPYEDAVKIIIENKKTFLFFIVSDGYLWSYAVRELCKKSEV